MLSLLVSRDESSALKGWGQAHGVVCWIQSRKTKPRCWDYFLRTGAAAFLIRAVALVASASFSKPNMAEYLCPTTCVIKRLRLIPASPIACVMAWPSPCRLSPWTSRVGIGAGARPAVFAAAMGFLLETGCSSIAAKSFHQGAIGHNDLQVGPRVGEGLKNIG